MTVFLEPKNLALWTASASPRPATSCTSFPLNDNSESLVLGLALLPHRELQRVSARRVFHHYCSRCYHFTLITDLSQNALCEVATP